MYCLQTIIFAMINMTYYLNISNNICECGRNHVAQQSSPQKTSVRAQRFFYNDNNGNITGQTDTTTNSVFQPQTFGAGSFGRHSAGNISLNFSFSVFGLTSEAENGQVFSKCCFWDTLYKMSQAIIGRKK